MLLLYGANITTHPTSHKYSDNKYNTLHRIKTKKSINTPHFEILNIKGKTLNYLIYCTSPWRYHYDSDRLDLKLNIDDKVEWKN